MVKKQDSLGRNICYDDTSGHRLPCNPTAPERSNPKRPPSPPKAKDRASPKSPPKPRTVQEVVQQTSPQKSREAEKVSIPTPSDSGSRKIVSQRELEMVQAKALVKAKSNPAPTPEEVKANRDGMSKLGANKFRRNLVGNTKDRAKRRAALLQEFGDGKTCPCIYCGLVIGEGTLEQDKILTTGQGGRYRLPNLVPSCSSCNKQRGDTPWEKLQWQT